MTDTLLTGNSYPRHEPRIVRLPSLSAWHRTSYTVPDDGTVVLGWVDDPSGNFAAMVLFSGTFDRHEWRLGSRVVRCRHWLPVTVED